MLVVLDGGLKINDLDNSKCIVCDRRFKHYKLLTMNKQLGIQEVELRTAHAGCFNLIKKRDKLKADLLNVEYDLFCKNERFSGGTFS